MVPGFLGPLRRYLNRAGAGAAVSALALIAQNVTVRT